MFFTCVFVTWKVEDDTEGSCLDKWGRKCLLHSSTQQRQWRLLLAFIHSLACIAISQVTRCQRRVLHQTHFLFITSSFKHKISMTLCHVDHIKFCVPCCCFDITNPKEQRKGDKCGLYFYKIMYGFLITITRKMKLYFLEQNWWISP
jgi:hypothetical protein